MLAPSPGNSVVPVKVCIAELVRTLGVGAKTAVPGNSDDAGNAVFEGCPVGADLQTKLGHHVIFRVEAGLERIDIVEIIKTEACFVQYVWRNDPRIRNHSLPGRDVEDIAIQVKRGRDCMFVIPTKAPEPARSGALDKVDALRELVLVARVVLQVQ